MSHDRRTCASPGRSGGPAADAGAAADADAAGTAAVAGDWDLVVVGAGPAGSAAALGALRADPGLRVLLLDREDFPRDKSCGDGIAPHVVDALAAVGADDAVDGWAPLRHLQIVRGPATVSRSLARPVWVVPRAVFDARLVDSAVAAGAELRRHRVRDIAVFRRSGTGAGAGAVRVDAAVSTRVLVGADGAHSVVRAATGLRAGRRRALAIRGYAPTSDAGRGRQRIVYGEHRQPSYAWAFDRGDGLSNIGYGELLGGEGPPPSRTLMLERLGTLVPDASAGGDGWRAHHLPLSDWSWRQPDGPLLLAGDAAGLVNPMTGEGIYYAVASGILAGRAAARALAEGAPERAGSLHRHAVRGLLGRHLRHTFVSARLSTVPAVLAAGLGAAARSQRVFDDLVEIGLGQGLLTPRLVGGLAGQLTRHRPARTA